MMAFRLNASFSYGTEVRREGKVCMCVVTGIVVPGAVRWGLVGRRRRERKVTEKFADKGNS